MDNNNNNNLNGSDFNFSKVVDNIDCVFDDKRKIENVVISPSIDKNNDNDGVITNFNIPPKKRHVIQDDHQYDATYTSSDATNTIPVTMTMDDNDDAEKIKRRKQKDIRYLQFQGNKQPRIGSDYQVQL